VLEVLGDAMNHGDNGVAVRNGQRSAWAKVVLHIDDD
jgi:hypothetical protein